MMNSNLSLSNLCDYLDIENGFSVLFVVDKVFCDVISSAFEKFTVTTLSAFRETLQKERIQYLKVFIYFKDSRKYLY